MSDMEHMELRPQRAMVEGPVALPRAEVAYRVEPEPGFIDFGGVWTAFRRNLWLILTISAVSVGIAALVVSRASTYYTATAIIRLINRNPGVTSGLSSDAPLGGGDPLASELMVLQGRNVIGRAVDREGFRLFDASTNAPATFVEEAEVTLEPDRPGTIHLQFAETEITYGSETNQRTVRYGDLIVVQGARFVVSAAPRLGNVVINVVPRDLAITYLSTKLATEKVIGTGGVYVTLTSPDPSVPAPAVNAIVRAYQEVNAELARENIVRRRLFIEEQLRSTDSLFLAAQADLSGFRTREQAYSASGRFSAEQGNLIQVEIQQAQLQAELRMYESALNRIVEARNTAQSDDLGSMMSLPGIGSDPAIGSLYSQLVNYQAQREDLLTGTFPRAPTHPDVRRLDILINSTEARLLAAAQSHLGSIRAQIGALGSLRGRALAEMSDLPRTEVQEVYLTQNVQALQQTADRLRDQYQTVRLEEAAEAGLVEIVQLATGAYPGTVNTWRTLFLGLLAGLIMGSAVALVREKMDHSINRPEDIEQYLLIPNLAVIPGTTPYLLESGSNGDSRGSLDPPGAEAYRILRANLLFSQGGLKTLVVTSAAPGEGKTLTAVNLSAAIARQGLRVLLMECDLRRPSLAGFFDDQDGRIDLMEVLLENRAWREAIVPSGVAGLDLLLASRTVPRASEYLAGPEMKKLLNELATQYDMVILDTSPLLVAADAAVLGAIADGVLLIVRATHTDREAVQQAMHQLDLVGAKVVGTVLNDPDGSMARYKTYYDYSAEYEAR